MTTAMLRRVQRVEARAEAADARPAWAAGSAATAFLAAPLAVSREWWIRALSRMQDRRPAAAAALHLEQAVYEAHAAGALRTPEQEALVLELFTEMEAVWADPRERAALLEVMRREPWHGWQPSTEGQG